jgi:catechol 2,3-dioxygenase
MVGLAASDTGQQCAARGSGSAGPRTGSAGDDLCPSSVMTAIPMIAILRYVAQLNMYMGGRRKLDMINLSGIGHVLLRVTDEEASKRFYRDVLGFRIAEQDPEHGGVFMTLGDGFHTIDVMQHPAPQDVPKPQPGQLGLAQIAFKVASYAALREAYAHLLKNGIEIQRAADHVCQRSIYFSDPDGNGLEIYYEMPRALELFPNGRGDEDEVLPLSSAEDPLPHWLVEDWPGPAAMAKVERLRRQAATATDSRPP